jgi:very-short-patch-repair endonuclease
MDSLNSKSRTSIGSQVENARRELLDIGLRNPLINYRMQSQNKDGLGAKRLPRRISVITDSVNNLFQSLTIDQHKFSFAEHATPKYPKDGIRLDKLDDPTNPQSASESNKKKHELRTTLPLEQLDKILLDIFRIARTFEEERGTNNLFLTLGLLKWFESDSSQDPRFAPLLLIPITLERGNVRSKFQISYSGEEVTSNHSIAYKFQEFNIQLPAWFDGEYVSVLDYFTKIKEAIAHQTRWEVLDNSTHVAFFSFGKFLMHRDLDANQWPEDQQPQDHVLLSALLGDGFIFEPQEIDETEHLDARFSPTELHHVLDADHSQTLVIHDVGQGKNLVVEGPPGTGKSQTITNMIADGVARGKRILFVAEKMAALEVVKRRLDGVGLGDMCLELHSQKTNKKTVLAELKRVLERSRPTQNVSESQLADLSKVRQKLNDYAEIINTSMPICKISPFQAFGELLTLSDRSHFKFDVSILLSWNQEDLEHRQHLLENLSSWLAAYGQPQAHRFWGSQKKTYIPLDERAMREDLVSVSQSTKHIKQLANHLVAKFGLTALHTLSEIKYLITTILRIKQAPDLLGMDVSRTEWLEENPRILQMLSDGLRLQRIHQRFDTKLTASAWQTDVKESYEVIQLNQQKNIFLQLLEQFTSARYRAAKQTLTNICQNPPPKPTEAQLELLNAIITSQKHLAQLEKNSTWIKLLVGTQWKGLASDFVHLELSAKWLSQFHQDVQSGELPSWATSFLRSYPNLSTLSSEIPELEQLLSNFPHQLEKVISTLEINQAVRFGQNRTWLDHSINDIAALVDTWITHISDLQHMARYNLLTSEIKINGLEPIQDQVHLQPEITTDLSAILRKIWLEAHLAQAYRNHPALAQFSAQDQDALVERFRTLDELTYPFQREYITSLHWESIAKAKQSNSSQMALLKRQFELKIRQMPIRKLMREANQMIQTLKPVLMMSPLSIASFLPPGQLNFDLVIFDEASQIKPADALGAILRGKQIVVVGDSKQLPPTTFFESTIAGEELDSDDESATSNIQSILGLCRSKNMPDRMLNWHYRSRHESLIAVSNRLFYDNKLIIFPSPEAAGYSGLCLHHLPQTIYDRGLSTTNLEEAKAIAAVVIQHAQSQPKVSLGVVAFSSSQQRAIEDQLELLRRQHPELEFFFNLSTAEPFFVKNLESVQGDERDIILISIGYGFDIHHKISMNFGPVNKQGGEKRLNVLFTRARQACEVFANFTADDLNVDAQSPEGMRALKMFLHHAKTGHFDLAIDTARGVDSPFEASVRDALIARGYNIKNQIGVAGYFIDLAVTNPKQAGAYLLGIECDGATYHSARSARDRDRLRQRVLESKGWKIHRIWSTDYFRNSARELERVIETIERIRLGN